MYACPCTHTCVSCVCFMCMQGTTVCLSSCLHACPDSPPPPSATQSCDVTHTHSASHLAPGRPFRQGQCPRHASWRLMKTSPHIPTLAAPLSAVASSCVRYSCADALLRRCTALACPPRRICTRPTSYVLDSPTTTPLVSRGPAGRRRHPHSRAAPDRDVPNPGHPRGHG